MLRRSVLTCLLVLPACVAQVNYDIVYVRAPRFGDSTYVRLPDVFYPTAMPSGSDLMLLHPNGAEETLFAAGKGAVLDPVVSFDAQWVFFSYIPDASSTGINHQRALAYGGADIYKINLATRQVIRLTQQIWTPPNGSANWSTDPLKPTSPNAVYLGYGVFNLGSCPLPGGKVMFVSSRDGYLPNREYTTPNLRLYIMDDDGRNVEPVGHLNIGSALHPTVLMDGRVMFASFESQGIRDERNWGLWAIWPDGRNWEPLMSAFREAGAFHFHSQLSDGRIAVTQYYNLNDNGFGTILALNSQKQPELAAFGSPKASDGSNPAIQTGLWGPGVGTAFQPRYTNFSFSPPGLVNLTAFSHGDDEASSIALDGGYAGKATHPAAAPNNDLLLVWTPGPANNLNRPTTIPYYDAGIYLLKGGQVVTDSRNLVKIKNDANYNELQPKAVVPYSAIYGIAQPAAIPFLPNDGTVSPLLPAGTPFGLIGTSSFYNRDTTSGYGSSAYGGMDSFNTTENGDSSNWFEQGADDGKYTNDDIFAVRILAMEGVAHRSYPNGSDTGFTNFAGRERLRILGEIPLRKPGVIDAQGNPDTSFLAKVPADTPISFQTLDKNGLVLNMAQTWHMVRPGEVRNNCGGCHAHSKIPLNFATTAAAQTSYPVADLTRQTPLISKDDSGNTIVKNANRLVVDVEYYKDIKPILQRSCVQCHSKTGSAAAGLVLDDETLVNGYDNTYNRLANDPNAQWGTPPVIASKTWRQSNASRYVRKFQSRRSLLAWKVFGQRLDGWLNSDHPTELIPGVASTLPVGSNANAADLDFTGTIMPPIGSGLPGLSEDEKITIARWIDLGAPITAQGDPTYKGYFADEIKPTVALSSPRSGPNAAALNIIRIGLFDAYSGINASSLSVTANFPVNGNLAGTELGPLFVQNAGSIWTVQLSAAVTSLANGHIVVKVKDNAENYTIVDRWFSIGSGGPPQPVTLFPSTVNLGQLQTQQFSATPNDVTWFIAPQVGTIGTTGLYTAPASITTQQNITVTAISIADATQVARAIITLNPPAPIRWSISGNTGIGAAAVTIGNAIVTADALGAYSFGSLSNGTYMVTPSKIGYTFTPANQTVVMNGANSTGINFTARPISISSLITTDANVSRNQGSTRSSVTSPVFSTVRGNELLLAFIATDYTSGTNSSVSNVTGAGLHWTLVARTNEQNGTSEIWKAFTAVPLSKISVKATLSQSAGSSMTVISFSGVDQAEPVGATGNGSARAGAPSATLVTTRNGSWVIGVGNDVDHAIARTAAAGQSLVHQYLSSTGDTYWVQTLNASAGAAGTRVTMSDTAPAGDRFNFAIVEIRSAQ